MILLADWAQQQARSLDSAGPPQAEEGSETLNNLVVDLLENIFVANRQAHGVAMRVEQARKLDDWAAAIAKTHGDRMANFKSNLDRQLAALFLPLLGERLEAKAVTDFCEKLKGAVNAHAARQLLISAPSHLHGQIARHLGGLDLVVNMQDKSVDEIFTSCAATEIVTEFGKWKTELNGQLSS
jgi:hypothetical protein